MSNVIDFPEAPKLPDIESFPIYLNRDTNEVQIPIVPDNRDDAAAVLAVFIDALIDSGSLTNNDVLQVALQATGKL